MPLPLFCPLSYLSLSLSYFPFQVQDLLLLILRQSRIVNIILVAAVVFGSSSSDLVGVRTILGGRGVSVNYSNYSLKIYRLDILRVSRDIVLSGTLDRSIAREAHSARFHRAMTPSVNAPGARQRYGDICSPR